MGTSASSFEAEPFCERVTIPATSCISALPSTQKADFQKQPQNPTLSNAKLYIQPLSSKSRHPQTLMGEVL